MLDSTSYCIPPYASILRLAMPYQLRTIIAILAYEWNVPKLARYAVMTMFDSGLEESNMVLYVLNYYST